VELERVAGVEGDVAVGVFVDVHGASLTRHLGRQRMKKPGRSREGTTGLSRFGIMSGGSGPSQTVSGLATNRSISRPAERDNGKTTPQLRPGCTTAGKVTQNTSGISGA